MAHASIVREGRQVITPYLAGLILSDHNYSHQRKIQRRHVESLAKTMRDGDFVSGSQIAFARKADLLILMNGQHRMTSVVASGVAIEFQVVIHDVETDDDLVRLYNSFDRNARVRSEADVLTNADIRGRYGVNSTMARAVFQAIPIIEHRFVRLNWSSDSNRRNDARRLALCEKWWPVAAVLETIMKDAPPAVKKKIISSQFVAVALVLLDERRAEAVEFLRGFCEDDGLRRDDPRKALLIALSGRTFSRHSLDASILVSVAWNAYYRNRTLSLAKVAPNAKVRLEGTTYEG